MKKKAAIMGVIIAAMLGGCGERAQEAPNEIEDNTAVGVVTEQTSTMGINSNAKDFETYLADGSFYVVDNGIFYPLVYYIDNYSGTGEVVNKENQKYYTTENEHNIPTLYSDCEIVYYSTTSLLDYLVWTRFYDLGYTIGATRLSEMTNGRIYLDLTDEDEMTIIPDSELYAIMETGAEYVLLDKIGGKQIDKTFINEGLINVVQKSKSYDLEVYTGTQFQHYTTTANIHAFREFEIFASIEYETLQDRFYKIEIPEYLPNGYYTLSGQGMFRLVRGESYSEETEFNEPILFPPLEEEWDGTLIAREEDEYVAPARYSEFEPLNKFKTNIPGALGYVDESLFAEEDDKENAPIILKEATIKEFELYFPKNKTCRISITSEAKEITGDIYVIIGNTMRTLNYDRLQEAYVTEFIGNGDQGTLVVAGLTKKYNIQLTNCEQYDEAKHGAQNTEEASGTVESETTETKEAPERRG